MNPLELRWIKSFIALDVKPCSLLIDSGSFGRTCCFQQSLMLGSCSFLAWRTLSIPTMEVTCPSEVSVKFQRAVGH
jgi:hypothetical protein